MQAGDQESMTWAELDTRMRSVPGGKNFVARMRARSFDEFIHVLHQDIDEVIKSMESNPQRHAKEDEDGLTYFIATMLKQRQYRARQGEVRGGSVDLTVEGHQDDFVWTSEAKIYHSLPGVQQGFLQLHTRYSPADLLHDKAGLLIYIKRPDAAALVNAWREEVHRLDFEDIKTMACPLRPILSFVSTHKSPRSGLHATTRHMSVSVYQDPQDKSGLTAKKHVSARQARNEAEQQSSDTPRVDI